MSKPLPICYCPKQFKGKPHVHHDGLIGSPLPNDMEIELRRLRRYERAVMAWLRERSTRTEERLATLAVASVKRSKEVRRG